ncbi:calpain family cysteine protease containing protein [Stylonychia lemnae]|uniref:Calpain family cysteine protease containing protein n=1 Tax=Stylonychia lemnae TaxID=5949 RepID=A0A077ZU42_STYLE|nr:calpain family cysteine protease containing protein [Stylonychia lemnae]|eukprot:CDW72805.1 calpain family cysteine protease containing protein [Stylonychia lemnae]
MDQTQQILNLYNNELIQKIQESKDLWAQISIEHTPVENITKQLRSFKLNFVDPSFTPSELSLYPQELVEVGGPFDKKIQWRRPKDFIQSLNPQLLPEQIKPEVFRKQIESRDIREGSLGDSWFLGAIATLAEHPQLLEKLFVNKTYNEEGVYRVRICKNGEWQSVTIDDYFPCFINGGPIFSTTSENELWVLILEKAYAKVHGSYLALRGGYAIEGIQDLTGCPSTQYDLLSQYVRQTIQNGDLWKLLQFYEKEQYLMSVSTDGEDQELAGNFIVQFQSYQDRETNLLKAHSYTILKIVEVNNNKLINLRNPWNAPFNFRGKWNENSPLWTQQMRRHLEPTFDKENSNFWISFEEFTQYFKTLNTCRIKNWEEIRVRGKYLRVQDKNNQTNEIVLSRWYYTLEIKKRTHVFIGIHQEDERIQGVSETRPYQDIGVLVLKQTSEGTRLVQMKELQETRQSELDIYLEEGTYFIIPKTSGCLLKVDNQEQDRNQVNFLKKQTKQPSDHYLSTLKDIFRKFDLQMNGELQYHEFGDFFTSLGFKINEQEFQSQILDKYCSTADGLTFHGFKDFMVASLFQYGYDNMIQWLYKLGYVQQEDRFISERSRVFIMTIHSEYQVQMVVNDCLHNDIEFKTQHIDPATSDDVIEEDQDDREFPIQVRIDLTQFNNVIQTNTHMPFIEKTIEPGESIFMFHAKITDANFKQPLKPTIQYHRLMQSEDAQNESRFAI